MYDVYKITNKINSKFYIGKSVNYKQRWSKHKWEAKNNTISYLYNAIRKYGIENFEIERICVFNTEIEALNYEIECIKNLKSNDKNIGYNLTEGGDSLQGFPKAPGTIEKLRQTNLGRKHSEEFKNNLSIKNSGVGNPFYGKKHTEDSLNKMSNYHKNKIVSVETREKLSKMRIGENNSFAKLSLIQVKEIKKLLSEKKLSHKEISIIYNVHRSTITSINRGKNWNKT